MPRQPIKTKLEKELFALKYAFWMRQDGIIPDSIVEELKKDARSVKATSDYKNKAA